MFLRWTKAGIKRLLGARPGMKVSHCLLVFPFMFICLPASHYLLFQTVFWFTKPPAVFETLITSFCQGSCSGIHEWYFILIEEDSIPGKYNLVGRARRRQKLLQQNESDTYIICEQKAAIDVCILTAPASFCCLLKYFFEAVCHLLKYILKKCPALECKPEARHAVGMQNCTLCQPKQEIYANCIVLCYDSWQL